MVSTSDREFSRENDRCQGRRPLDAIFTGRDLAVARAVALDQGYGRILGEHLYRRRGAGLRNISPVRESLSREYNYR